MYDDIIYVYNNDEEKNMLFQECGIVYNSASIPIGLRELSTVNFIVYWTREKDMNSKISILEANNLDLLSNYSKAYSLNG